MRSRTPNPRLPKIHRAWVDEAARLFSVHPNTVRQGIKAGLPTVDDGQPILIHGTEAHGTDGHSETARAH